MEAGVVLGADGLYRCPAFQQFEWQEHAFGSRTAVPEAATTLRQIHSSHVLNAYGVEDRDCEGDALITNEPGKRIGVRTADCVSILMLDSETRAVAAIHAGWRGTAANIAHGAVESLAREFGSKPRNLRAAIGPCIRECCYEVGADVYSHFLAWLPERAPCDVKPRLNLPAVNRLQLIAAGLDRERVFDSGLCTACDAGQFYSFRRDPSNAGRMVSVICRSR